MLAVHHREWLDGFALCLAFLGAFVLAGFGFFAPLRVQSARMQASRIALPVQEAMHWPVREAVDFIQNGREYLVLRNEARDLKRANADYRDRLRQMDAMRVENMRLKGLLHWVDGDRAGLGFTTAPLIYADKGFYAHSLLAAFPENAVVCVGSPVLDGDGLLGRVSELESGMGRVLLIDDPQSQIPVYMKSTQARAIMIGANNGRAELRYYGSDALPQDGETVVTRAQGYMPGDIPVGKVRVRADNRVEIAPFGDLADIRVLRVLRNGAYPSEKSCRALTPARPTRDGKGA